MSTQGTTNTKDKEDDESLDDYIPPRIKPRSMYDSQSRTSLIQSTYDLHHLDVREKKIRKETRLANQEKKRKIINTKFD